MRKKNLMAVLMCVFCLTATSVAPAAVYAQEAETQENADAAAEADAEEADEAAEADTEAVDEADADAAEDADADAVDEIEPLPERPDYTALDYVTLGEYMGLEVQLSHTTDEDVEAEIVSRLRQNDLLETLSEGTVQDGDIANIDYEGKLNGDAFDGGTAKAYDLEIGSGTFIDGFEEGLIGVAVGDTVDLTLTFPEDYYKTELAGQETVFTVTVNEIQRAPELTDELCGTLSEGAYTDTASYREAVKAELEADLEGQRESEIKYNLMVQIANTSEIKEYPQELVDYGVALMESSYEEMAQAYSMEFEEFLSAAYSGMTIEEFREEAAVQVKGNMQQELILKAIAETEGLEVSDEEYAAGCEQYRSDYGFETTEELEAYYSEGIIRISILQEKVLDFLMDNAVVQEETETEGTSAEETTEAGDAAEAEDSAGEAEGETEAENAEAGESEEAVTESGEAQSGT